MGNIAISFALSHKDFLVGMASGYALAHIPEAVDFVFHLVMKIPWVRSAILKDPEKSKAIIKEIESEMEKDIDSEAKSDAPKAP